MYWSSPSSEISDSSGIGLNLTMEKLFLYTNYSLQTFGEIWELIHQTRAKSYYN